MKNHFLIFTFILFSFSNIFSQRGTIKVVKPQLTNSAHNKILIGYFIVGCFSPEYNCKNFDPGLGSKTPLLRECNFYKSISSIKYVKLNDLDLKKIDDFNYQIKLQEKENDVYLSNNPLILLETNNGDSSILKKNDLFLSIQQNIITAELIESAIEKLKLNFKNVRHHDVLLKVSVTVIDLPQITKTPNDTPKMAVDKYLILQDDKNKVEGVKIIKNPF